MEDTERALALSSFLGTFEGLEELYELLEPIIDLRLCTGPEKILAEACLSANI